MGFTFVDKFPEETNFQYKPSLVIKDHYVTLEIEDKEGNIWSVFTLFDTGEGSLELDIPTSIGLKVDKQGRVKLLK